MAKLFHVDFKARKLINTSNTGSLTKQWTCASCKNVYNSGDGIKGVAFTKGMTVCENCIGEAHKMIFNGG
jgi:hypothetical protein